MNALVSGSTGASAYTLSGKTLLETSHTVSSFQSSHDLRKQLFCWVATATSDSYQTSISTQSITLMALLDLLLILHMCLHEVGTTLVALTGSLVAMALTPHTTTKASLMSSAKKHKASLYLLSPLTTFPSSVSLV